MKIKDYVVTVLVKIINYWLANRSFLIRYKVFAVCFSNFGFLFSDF
jgi:hypothetical protein